MRKLLCSITLETALALLAGLEASNFQPSLLLGDLSVFVQEDILHHWTAILGGQQVLTLIL